MAPGCAVEWVGRRDHDVSAAGPLRHLPRIVEDRWEREGAWMWMKGQEAYRGRAGDRAAHPAAVVEADPIVERQALAVEDYSSFVAATFLLTRHP